MERSGHFYFVLTAPKFPSRQITAALDTELNGAESDLLTAASQRVGIATSRKAVARLAGRFHDCGLAVPPATAIH